MRRRKLKRVRDVVIRRVRLAGNYPSVWARLFDGTKPQIDLKLYYRLILIFLILVFYLIIGGGLLWAIEQKYEKLVFIAVLRMYLALRALKIIRRQLDRKCYLKTFEIAEIDKIMGEDFSGIDEIPENTDKSEKTKNSTTNFEYSRKRSTFDSVFLCYAYASGSGGYPELSVASVQGTTFMIFYTMIGCAIVSLVTTYLTKVLTSFALAMSIFLSNVLDIFLDFVFNKSRPENPLRSKNSVEEIYKNGLSLFLSLFYFTVFICFGSLFFLYGESVGFYEMVVSSYNAFATLEVGRVFNVPARGWLYLIYLLAGISSFQLCVEALKNLLEYHLFEDEPQPRPKS